MTDRFKLSDECLSAAQIGLSFVISRDFDRMFEYHPNSGNTVTPPNYHLGSVPVRRVTTSNEPPITLNHQFEIKFHHLIILKSPNISCSKTISSAEALTYHKVYVSHNQSK
ncbi:hypothetical protein HanRHA438_Chr17g0835541 [Helianthus annuus]|nr:hypothetical protein HanRHA438_Chr17g0835541 [Helianthus annuus]